MDCWGEDEETEGKAGPAHLLHHAERTGTAGEVARCSATTRIPRNEMLLKLFFGAHVPIQILVGNVERMVEEHSALLQKLKRVEHDGIDKNPQYPDAPFWRMAARYGQ